MYTRTATSLACLAACAACVVKGNIPDLQRDALCASGYQQRIPSFCDWAHSTDAIVVGKVVGLRWDLSSPVSLASGGDAQEGCEPISGVLEIDLELTTVLAGPLSVGERVGVIGQETVSWRPKPSHDDGDPSTVVWLPPEEPGFVAGQQLGVVLHREQSGEKWGTRFEPFFLEEGGRVRFSRMLGMCELAAPVFTGDFTAVSDFDRAIDACPVATPAAAERSAAIAAGAQWRPICHDRTSVESDTDPQE